MLSLPVARPSVVAVLSPWVVPLVPNQLISCVYGCVKNRCTYSSVWETDSGTLQWSLPSGNIVALRKFRDNLLVAAKGLTPQTGMYPVCMTMESFWNLQVLFPCRDKDLFLTCHGQCMQQTVRCMGVSIYVSPACTLAHTHPNALDDIWRFKFGAPLQSSWATTTRRTPNILISALSNTLPFIQSGGSFLLSCAAWILLAVLSGYPVSTVRASAVAAVHHVLANPPGMSHSLCAGLHFCHHACRSRLATPLVTS